MKFGYWLVVLPAVAWRSGNDNISTGQTLQKNVTSCPCSFAQNVADVAAILNKVYTVEWKIPKPCDYMCVGGFGSMFSRRYPLDDSCYRFIPEKFVPYFVAKMICADDGAWPVAIETKEEQLHLRAVLTKYESLQMKRSGEMAGYWTSGERKGKVWKWRGKGQKVEYFNWGRGEPDNNIGQDHLAIRLSDFGWYDIPNGFLFAVICEQNAQCLEKGHY